MGISILNHFKLQDSSIIVQTIDTQTDAVSFYIEDNIPSVLKKNSEDKDKAIFYIDYSAYLYHNNIKVGNFILDCDQATWHFKSLNNLVNIDTTYNNLIQCENFVISSIMNNNLIEQLIQKKDSPKIK